VGALKPLGVARGAAGEAGKMLAADDAFLQARASKADVEIINLGTDWSAGDNVLMFSSAVNTRRARIKDGTAEAPITAAGPTFKVSRTEAVTDAAIVALGGAGTDGADVVAAIQGISQGLAASETQTVGLYGGARNASTSETGNPDACGVYGIGRITGGTAAKATGIGGCFVGRREVSTADLSGIEVTSHNRGGAGNYSTNGASKTKGIWIAGAGTTVSDVGVQIGNPNSLPFKVGYAVNNQNGGAVSDSSFRDDGEAKRSIDIRGKHSEGSVIVGAESGPVILGAEALTTTTTQKLEINVGSTNSNPALRLQANANTSLGIRVNNTHANLDFAQAGGTNALMTGTTAGDGCVIVGNSATLHIGRSAVRGTLRVGSNVGIGAGAGDSAGGGVGVVFLANAGTNPSTNPTGGGVLYASGGALFWRGSSGTVKELAGA
jgi:hypothetical protein